MTLRSTLVTTIVLMILAVSGSIAQTGMGQGEIVGFVKDADGKAVANASITVISDALINDRTIVSGNNGYYRIPNLPPGQYSLRVEKQDYRQTVIENIAVRAGQSGSLNITLEVGEFSETVTITQEAPLIDTQTPERQINIDGDFMERLPLSTTREWTEALTLVPSVVSTQEFTGGKFDSTFGLISFHGAETSENVFNLDGASIQTDNFYSPVMFTSAIIEDVEVVTSGYDASVRSGLGGYVNIITRSGGNEFSGTLQATLQPESWNWENVDDGNTPKSELYMPEASAGGPILEDRAWFFTSILYDYRRQGIFRDETSLFWMEQNGFGPADYDYEDERESLRFFGKITWAMTDSDKLVATYNWDRNEDLVGSAETTTSGRYVTKSGGPFLMLNYTKAFSDSVLLSVQGSYREAETGDYPSTGDLADIKPLVELFGEVIRFGPLIGFGDRQTVTKTNGLGIAGVSYQRHTEFRGDLNLFIEDLGGQHDLSVGAYYMPERLLRSRTVTAQPFARLSQVRDTDGEFKTFEGLARSDSAPPEEFLNAIGAAYLQDSWTLNDRLTLNLGLRYEQNFDEVGIWESGAVSPNIGAAYALTSDQRQVIRISYSRKQEVLVGFSDLLSTYQQAITAGLTYYNDDDLDGVWDRVRGFPEEDVQVNTADNLVYFGTSMVADQDLEPGNADYFQIGYSSVLPWNVTFDAAFLYNVFSNDPRQYFYNVIWENGMPTGLRFPSEREVLLFANNEWSSDHYRGLEFSLSRAFHNDWQLMASYAWQTTTRKGEWAPYEPERYFFPESWFEYTDVRNQARHVFRVAASYVGPYNIMFNGNLVYRSSLPGEAYTFQNGTGVTVPPNLILDGQFLIHPFYNMEMYAQPRSADREGVIDSVTSLNLGVGKIFSLGSYRFEAQLQIFNVFNGGDPVSGRRNFVDQDFSFSNVRIFEIQSPRAAQLLVKFVF